MTTTLLLLRHAHTEANEQGAVPRMAGWSDVELSATGKSQLLALARADLGNLAPIVYASTLPRAVRTARAAANGRPIVLLRSLREISCGTVDGWLVSEVEARHPELWQRNMQQNDPHFAWPNGESYRKFRWRVLRALRGIAARHRGERTLVVTHSGVISQALGFIHGVTPAAWETYRASNGSLTTVECDDDGTCRLAGFDARTHLDHDD